jgi:hypothetical protein
MSERRTVIQLTYRRYQKAVRKKKTQILEEFVALTGYKRVYAALVLRQWRTERWVVDPQGSLRLVAGARRPKRRPGKRRCDQRVRKALIQLWYLCDCMCGKRLIPALRSLLPVFLRWGEIQLDGVVQDKLRTLSPATADRLLREERKRLRLKRGHSHTRPAASSLVQQIPQFTRARPYRKNDNCFVEEKNNSLVRRSVGYQRYDTEEELALLREIYQRQTLLSNYFYPCMKLVGKSRRGSRVYRRYDTPRTPYQRLLERPEVSDGTKQELTRIFNQLNPALLKRELTELQQQLFQLAASKPPPHGHARGKEFVIKPRLG